ncbi:MAG: ankyrin repeat domain-containing protein [Alphaproteobacteria bacterium]|nr:ankyrin repeat domain-containing protein [Alphaproteobacteria bacterium]
MHLGKGGVIHWSKKTMYRSILRDMKSDRYDARYRDGDMLKALKAGADPNAPGEKFGRYPSPLFFVMRNLAIGEDAVVSEMVRRGVSLQERMDGMSAAHCAISYRCPETLAAILDRAPEQAYAQDEHGRTPLMYAIDARRGAEYITPLLHVMSENKGIVDSNGKTFLHYVAHSYNACAADLIAEVASFGDADINARDKNGLTPLHAAAGAGVGANNVRAILALPGIDIDAQDNDGNTPLDWTLYGGDSAAAKVLLNAGAQINTAQSDSIVIAARRGILTSELYDCLSSVAAVQEKELNVNGALEETAKAGDLKAALLLTAKGGADVNTVGEGGMTPLLHAVKGGHLSCVLMLLERGADPMAQDDKGISARAYAAGLEGEQANEVLVALDLACANRTPSSPSSASAANLAPKAASCMSYDLGDGLTCTFNFEAQQVIYCKGAAMSVENFDAVQRQDSIQSAYNDLVAQNKGAALPPPPSVRLNVAGLKPRAVLLKPESGA